MRLIGVSGPAGSGKDTFADFLAGDHRWVKIALADPIKRAAADWFDWDHERLWGPSTKRNEPDPRYGGLSARKALQFMGTEIGRKLYPDVWIDYALRTTDELLRFYSGVVISDVRFKNEVAAIRKAGGRLVRLRRGQPLPGTAGQHRSETEMQEIPDDLFDVVIDNRMMSLDELRVAANGFMKEHF